MKVEDIKLLAKAGFTAEQIAAFSQLGMGAAAPDPVEKQTDPYQKIIDKVGELETSFQRAMVNNAQQPEVQPETADSILANIINPKGDK